MLFGFASWCVICLSLGCFSGATRIRGGVVYWVLALRMDTLRFELMRERTLLIGWRGCMCMVFGRMVLWITSMATDRTTGYQTCVL